MTWQQTLHEGAFTASNFLFADGRQIDLRLAYRTIGKLAPDRANAVLLLHGTVGSGQQFLKPAFADSLFDAGEPLDARKHFIILPDAIGHGKSSKPSDGMGQDFPRYGYSDVVEAQHCLVTEGLGLHRLSLVMGTSMGGMQTWMWGERYPHMMDALMPVASLPERVTGRNLLWRRLLLQVARLDEPGQSGSPARGLGLAWVLFQMMAASPARLAESLDSPEQADAFIQYVGGEARAREDLLDVIWEFEASRDYDPAPHLSGIRAPLLAVNFTDDAVNPAELGVMDRMIAQVNGGRTVLLPATDTSNGHQTLLDPASWKEYLRGLLRRAGVHADATLTKTGATDSHPKERNHDPQR
jgi:homoserine O-acetyltransferase/O-succinyltransferase